MKSIISFFTVKLLILSIALSSFQSCNKSIDVTSSHLVGEENEWKTITDTRSALLGIYGLTRAALAENNAHWMWGELREGDFQSVGRQDIKAINESQLNARYDAINKLKNWRRFYAVINAASLFIEQSPKVLALDPLYTEYNHKIDVAQARVLRAFAYFYMSRIWGDVPLITKAFDDGSFVERPANSQDEVLAFAEREILAAVEDLEYRYGANNQLYYSYNESRWAGVLMTKISAYSILAHIAAWRGNYIDAEIYTKFVLDNYSKSGIAYVATNNLVAADGFFNDKNLNQIVAFNFVYAHGEATVNGHIEELTLASPLVLKNLPEIYVPKDSIIKVFNDPENRDSRFGLDTLSGLVRTNYFTNYSSSTPIFSKIKVIRGGTTDGDFAIFGSAIVFTRLEDIVLLRAESLAALNRIGPAMDMVNSIRTRRSLPNAVATTQQDALREIFAERRRELMGEGHRWYDQIRYNRLVPHNPTIVNFIQNDGIYWPLGEEVLSNNRQLTQNEYWK